MHSIGTGTFTGCPCDYCAAHPHYAAVSVDPRFQTLVPDLKTEMPTWGVPGETPEEGEWPARDKVPDWRGVGSPNDVLRSDGEWVKPPIGLRPAEVTPEMLKAADVAEQSMTDPFTSEGYFAAIYRAMNAVAPVALVSDAEIALTKRLNVARAHVKAMQEAVNESCLLLVARAAAEEALQDQVTSLRAELERASHDPHPGFTLISTECYERTSNEVIALRAELMAAQADIIQLEKSIVRVADLEDDIERFKAARASYDENIKDMQALIALGATKPLTPQVVVLDAPDPIANAIRTMIPQSTEGKWDCDNARIDV